MNEPLQFEFSIKEIGIDERLSDSLVTETEDQKEAICRLCRIYSGENVLIGGKGDIFPMFTTLYTSEKCFFLRVHDTVEKCKNTVDSFGQWCLKKTKDKEKLPSSLYLFITGSTELKMTNIGEIFDSILSVNKELICSQFLKIDETIVQLNLIEVSIILA